MKRSTTLRSPANKPVITIDGTFASGKGTLGKALAEHYDLPYLDTGKLYRAVALTVMETGINISNIRACEKVAKNLDISTLDHPKLKSGPVGAAASKVAQHKPVRAALLTFQKDFAKAGAVMDGRDMGTIVCPLANVKLYVDASESERARRRYTELKTYGEDITIEDVLQQLRERDARDMNRAEAPLKPAQNAHLLDTTNLSIERAFDISIKLIDAVLASQLLL